MKLHLTRYGEHGWEWTLTTLDWDGRESTTTYRTNGDGEGLWQWAATGNSWYPDGRSLKEWKQTVGTCQFSLPNGRHATDNRIRRYFSWEPNR